MKYFGTDGIRGNASALFTYELCYKVGFFLGQHHKQNKIIIGYDTRESGPVIAKAISDGIVASGGSSVDIGVVSTPAIAYLVQTEVFDYGIMISASHNPYSDNGIKIFDERGLKLSADIEAQIEQYIDGLITLTSRGESKSKHTQSDLVKKYITYLRDSYGNTQKFKLLIDAANGSASNIIKEVLTDFSLDVTYINNKPNGKNINEQSGSTHIDLLQQKMRDARGAFDYGIAFDGDADRVLFTDSTGKLLDGDYIVYLLAKYYEQKAQLRDNTAVVTVMANYGLFKAFKAQNINTVITDVGDKYIQQEIIAHNYKVGGEQSGHIIFNTLVKSGDGIFTMLQILNVISEVGESFSEYTKEFVKYPQLLINEKVKDKHLILNDKTLQAKVAEVEEALQNNGRILVRASGTEHLVRVMVEAESVELTRKHAEDVAALVQELNKKL